MNHVNDGLRAIDTINFPGELNPWPGYLVDCDPDWWTIQCLHSPQGRHFLSDSKWIIEKTGIIYCFHALSPKKWELSHNALLDWAFWSLYTLIRFWLYNRADLGELVIVNAFVSAWHTCRQINAVQSLCRAIFCQLHGKSNAAYWKCNSVLIHSICGECTR